MVDIAKHADFWKKGALEDWDISDQLLQNGKIRHALFFTHLALEKLLKGLYCLKIKNIPPRIHNLARLNEIISLSLSEQMVDILADINQFNMEGRYPEMGYAGPTLEEAVDYKQRAE